MQKLDLAAVKTAIARIDGSLICSRAQLAWLMLLIAAGAAHEQTSGPLFPNPWLTSGLRWLMYLMEVPIIVNVHRRLLLNELPEFRLSVIELRYAIITFVIFFLRIVLIEAIPLFFNVFGLAYAQLAYTVAEALLLVLIIPLTLLLPAAATARKYFSLRDAAEAAKKHLFLILGYFFLLALFLGLNRVPFFLVQILIPVGGSDLATLHLADIGRGALTGCLFFLYAVIGGAILSLVYAAVTAPPGRPVLSASRDTLQTNP